MKIEKQSVLDQKGAEQQMQSSSAEADNRGRDLNKRGG